VRAAIVESAGQISVTDLPPVARRPDRVTVAPLYVGLCGSDLSYFTRGANGAFVIREPLILGHEVTGVVTAVGSEIRTGVAVGDLVVVHPLWPSPPAGHSSVPVEFADHPTSFLGSASTAPHTMGGLAEQLQVRAEQLHPIPEVLPVPRATLAEPLSVVLHALQPQREAITGASVLVCGAGPIGLLAVVALRRLGARRVVITDLYERPLMIAANLGADAGLRVGGDEALPSDSFDLAVEATGAASSLNAALDALRPGGTLIQLGMLSREGVTADLSKLVVKELTMVGSHRFSNELGAAIAVLADAPECDEIVTSIVPLENVRDALAEAADSETTSKVLVSVTAQALM
jgi:L-idonate 5-dehydrogenase